MKLVNYIFIILILNNLFSNNLFAAELDRPEKKMADDYCLCPQERESKMAHPNCTYCLQINIKFGAPIIKKFTHIFAQKNLAPEVLYNLILELNELDPDFLVFCLRYSWKNLGEIYTKVNKAGQNIIHLAFANNNRHVASIILCAFREIPCGHFLALCDFEGNTPLHLAAKAGHAHIIEWFIFVANMQGKKTWSFYNFKNSKNQTPADLVDNVAHINIFVLLKEAEKYSLKNL